MRLVMSLVLASLFVFLAGFNVWNMLTSRVTSARSTRFWINVHHACGYAFLALYFIFCYFMLLRLRGQPDELSPRLIVHEGLALALAPLLFVKVIVARYQKSARGVLTALGIAIFAIAFTLVALNVSTHYLRQASAHKAPFSTSITFVVVVLLSVLIAYFAARPKVDKEVQAAIGNLPQKLGNSRDVLNLILARIEPQTHDAKTLRFLLPRGKDIAVRPGQFLTFEWMIDGKPVARSYTICSSPTRRSFIDITSKRMENGCVSRFLNDRARMGLNVKARGPYGRFYFDESEHKRIVLVAAGSGITPMIAMLRYIDDLCISTDATLIYCIRTAQDAFFKDELVALQRRLTKFRCVMVLSQPSVEWTGWKGRLRREILQREVEKPSESTFFLCGPPAFMELGRTLLREMAVEPSQILQESFGSAVAGGTHPTAATGPLEIRFARSKIACRISPGENLLESSEKNGVLMQSGCRQGSCGTCAIKLLDGKVQMEGEEALTDDLRSQGFVLPCVSRVLSDLTLDA